MSTSSQSSPEIIRARRWRVLLLDINRKFNGKPLLKVGLFLCSLFFGFFTVYLLLIVTQTDTFNSFSIDTNNTIPVTMELAYPEVLHTASFQYPIRLKVTQINQNLITPQNATLVVHLSVKNTSFVYLSKNYFVFDLSGSISNPESDESTLILQSQGNIPENIDIFITLLNARQRYEDKVSIKTDNISIGIQRSLSSIYGLIVLLTGGLSFLTSIIPVLSFFHKMPK